MVCVTRVNRRMARTRFEANRGVSSTPERHDKVTAGVKIAGVNVGIGRMFFERLTGPKLEQNPVCPWRDLNCVTAVRGGGSVVAGLGAGFDERDLAADDRYRRVIGADGSGNGTADGLFDTPGQRLAGVAGN